MKDNYTEWAMRTAAMPDSEAIAQLAYVMTTILRRLDRISTALEIASDNAREGNTETISVANRGIADDK